MLVRTKHCFYDSQFLFSALTTVPACQWFLTSEGDSDLYGKGGLRTLLSRDATGTGLDMVRTACGTRVCFCSGRPGNELSNSCANYG